MFTMSRFSFAHVETYLRQMSYNQHHPILVKRLHEQLDLHQTNQLPK